MGLLVEWAKEFATKKGKVGISDCPDRSGGCVRKLHCGKDCQCAVDAHRTFSKLIPRTTTLSNGSRGMLTAGVAGSFETIQGEVIYDIR